MDKRPVSQLDYYRGSGQEARRKEQNMQAVNTTPHINEGKGTTLVPSTVKLLHREKEKKNQRGSRGLQACLISI